jgi:hypothetical protein
MAIGLVLGLLTQSEILFKRIVVEFSLLAGLTFIVACVLNHVIIKDGEQPASLSDVCSFLRFLIKRN